MYNLQKYIIYPVDELLIYKIILKNLFANKNLSRIFFNFELFFDFFLNIFFSFSKILFDFNRKKKVLNGVQRINNYLVLKAKKII